VLEEIARVIHEHEKFIISTHVNPEGDAIGSCMALKYLLEHLGKTVWIINTDPTPEALHFLDPEGCIQVYSAGTSSDVFQKAQVHITVDVNEAARMGEVAGAVKKSGLVKIILDHHPPGDHHGEYTCIDPSAAAGGELVGRLYQKMEIPFSPQAARALYFALMTDTGGFRFSNTTAETHRLVAELIEAGADPQELFSAAYEQGTIERFRLFQKVVATAQFTADNQIAWMTCPRSFFDETGTSNPDLEDFVNTPRGLTPVEVSILFSEPNPGKVRISMRSKRQVAVNEIARQFSGGGHLRAAGAVFEGTLEQAQRAVIAAVEQALKQASN
jgi:phosphoesterase RecJ-like protein